MLSEKMGENIATNVKWSSRVEYVVALLGYSIGMPEFWRVPYLTYRNGGGPFIIAYILLMLICGLPLYFLELALSQYSGKGPWKFWDICPLLRGVGIAIAVINGLSAVKAGIMAAWVFEYFVSSFKAVLPWTSCDNDWNTQACYREGSHSLPGNVSVFNTTASSHSIYNSSVAIMNESHAIYTRVDAVEEFWMYRILRISSGIEYLGTVSLMYVLYLLVMRLIAAISIVKSVESLGKVLYVTALVPVLLVVAIWIRALTLPGATKGMLYFLAADFSRFADENLWIEAAFQTFITLGPGWGGLMMMGAHNKFETNCFRASVISTSATLTFGLFNGFVVFSVLGVMSEEIGIPISDLLTAGGFSIGFIAYPKALSYFPLPQLWCAIFYIVLLLPGLDVMAIVTEPFLMVLEEIFPKFLRNRRLPLLVVVSVVMFLMSLPFATQAGAYMFILVDWYSGSWSVTLICLAECIVFAWVYGTHRIDRDIRLMLHRPLPAIIRFSTAFVMPIFLTCLLVISMFTYKPPTLGEYSYPAYARAVGWCFTFSSLIPGFGYCVWVTIKSEGTLMERLRHLSRHTPQWGPANDKVEESHRQTEESAEYTWRRLFWFNLTGKGGLVIDESKDTMPMI